ncbi:hypothetical protein AVEN_107035-1 [Araneus ventricosus]|uniref:DUF5641 domain-containing protein n=1 Tax=Araneus ventricosus TaxID=182803 RepID=A0A4Y2M8B7_ARAVE|nr:hypothetical protein AVEN_107035-1 [Araneus ventricosus]
MSGISTEAILVALRRFVARRGRCSTIYSDNGTNFVGAANILHSLDWKQVIKFGTVNAIDWKFNPPTGTWWERLIRIMKDLLKRVLGKAYLSHEEMTVLCDSEAIINSRPITYISENDTNFTPISPSMFIQDVREWAVPDLDVADHYSLSKRNKYRQTVQKDLLYRFWSEYLGHLVQRRTYKESRPISVGDIVLVGSDNLERIHWPLGKIIELLPGKNKEIRLIRVTTANSVLLRPVQRIYPLEVSLPTELPSKLIPQNSLKTMTISDSEHVEAEPKFTRSGRKIKEESEGDDYDPDGAHDSDVDIEDDADEDDEDKPRGQKRKLESDDE